MRPEVAKGVDLIVVRELIGGAYFGPRKEQGVAPQEDSAWDTMIYSVSEVQRITRVAAQIALAANPPLEVHSIDKANVLASSRLWRKVVTETLESEYPQLKLDHHLVDSAAMVIVANPRKLNGVILTENLFGDMYARNFTRFAHKNKMTPNSQPVGSVQCHPRIPGSPPLGFSRGRTFRPLCKFSTHNRAIRANPRFRP